MNVTEEAGKNSDTARIKCHWVEKKVSAKFTLRCCLVENAHRKVLLFSPEITELWTKKRTTQ